MSIKEDDISKGRLIYSCNCGWIDTGHADPSSKRAYEGASHLWGQIDKETGPRSKRSGVDGFKVIFAEQQGVPIFGDRWFSNGTTGEYFVRSGLTPGQKESVALAIFLDVSFGFEAHQGVAIISALSSFSQEDLVSDLIGFYRAVRPNIDYKKLCDFQGKDESLEVFKGMSFLEKIARSTGSNSPAFYPCKHCSKPEFPADFKSIVPAKKGGKYPLFRHWELEDQNGNNLIPMMPFIYGQKHPQGHSRILALREDSPKIRAQTVQGRVVKV